MHLRGRDLLDLADFTSEEVQEFLHTASLLKMMKRSGISHTPLTGKSLGMIFEKPSTRTRVSFEVATFELGGHALYLGASDLQLKRGETIGDTAQTLSRYLTGIMGRVFSHQTLVELAQYAHIPVINGLSDLHHPCQALGDLLTIKEKKGSFKGIKLTYIGDGNNVCNSLLIGGAKVGLNVSVATPSGYEPPTRIVEQANLISKTTGSVIEITNDLNQAIKNSDAVYTDVWASMGQESETDSRKKIFLTYQVNMKLLSFAAPDVIVLHCLPAHRGEEITDEVMDGIHSAVFDQAENRLHAQKAVLALLL